MLVNAFSFTFSLADFCTFCKFKLNHFASFFMPLHVLFAAWLWALIKLSFTTMITNRGNGGTLKVSGLFLLWPSFLSLAAAPAHPVWPSPDH